jgi:hypothetical protein
VIFLNIPVNTSSFTFFLHTLYLGKGDGRMNIVQILCTMYLNGKMIPVETVPGTCRVRDKGFWRG